VNTTEIFVEQVLIGVLVLLIAALPFVSAIPPDLPDAFKIIGTAIGVVGVAYLLGIPFDRFADSLTSSLEKRIRLKLCLKRPLPGSEDPFPEDLLKIAVLQAESGTVAWAEYLRSRMRLTRAVAVFAPGLTLSAMLATWPAPVHGWQVSSAQGWAVIGTLGMMSVIYAIAFLSALRAEKDLPRTSSLWDRDPEQRTSTSFAWKSDPVPWMLLPFIAIGVVLAMNTRSELCTLIGVVGLLTTLLTGWSWARITKTYMTFLADFERWKQQQPAPGVHA
jgi:hypothetical protein